MYLLALLQLRLVLFISPLARPDDSDASLVCRKTMNLSQVNAGWFEGWDALVDGERVQRLVDLFRTTSTLLEQQAHDVHSVQVHDSILFAILQPASFLIGTYGVDDGVVRRYIVDTNGRALTCD